MKNNINSFIILRIMYTTSAAITGQKTNIYRAGQIFPKSSTSIRGTARFSKTGVLSLLAEVSLFVN